ncbi:MAG: amino acid permease [Nanoarchaeota archaeon]|nr:amino acid permease [Nanoarchaeota archaeon]
MVQKNEVKGTKFSTMSGVFVPSVLAILGAVLYLITPQVLGGVGLLKMLAIILIAHSITIATAFSISSIATNIHVKGGGLYYLISRSLGNEFGGSMGIQLFLAQTVAAAFYIIAFAKGLVMLGAQFGMFIPETTTAMLACIFFFVLSFRGAKFVIRIQYFILISILLSVVAILLGPTHAANTDLLATGISIPFWVAFAMFFPAVTGIDAGVGMSGDLKDPKKSLVIGTFASIVFTMVIYTGIAIKMFYAADPAALSSEPFILEKIAIFPPLVFLGIILATSSSALSQFMTAPRSLRAMVQDRIIPKFFSFLGGTIGKSSEPRNALIFSFIIAMFVISMGKLEFVSQVVAMFFLNVYGWINGAAFFEKISGNPSYRPSFNSPVIISFYGMLACYFVMYLFNPWVMAIGIAFQIVMFYILSKTKSSVKLESVWDGVLFQMLRKVINRIEKTERSKKNWRPIILAVCANQLNRTPMFSMLTWIGGNRGIMKHYFLFKGNLQKECVKKDRLEEEMRTYVKERELELYPKVIMTTDFNDSFETVVQSETIGNLPVNTVLLDFDENLDLQRLINSTICMKKNLVILRNQKGFTEFNKVDVWYNSPENGNLMLLLAYLITHSQKWKSGDALIRLFNVVPNQAEADKSRARLERLIGSSRIENVSINILIERSKRFEDIVFHNSKYSDLVILGIPDFREEMGKIVTNTKRLTDSLKMSLIVFSHEKIDLRVN